VTTQFYPGFASSDSDTAFAMGGMQDNGSSIFNGSPDWSNLVLGGDGSEAAIDPNDNNIVYLSMYKLSIFKSINRGKYLEYIGPVNFFPYWWQNPMGRDPKPDEVAKLAPFTLLDNNIIYAATNYVYKSYNGGDSWFPCNSDKAVTAEPIMSISVSEIDPNVVYVSSRPNLLTGILPRVRVSKDGGDSWIFISGNLPNRDIIVQVAPHSPGIVYAVIGGFGTSHLFRSYDYGSTWTDIGAGLPDVPTNAIAIDPDYPQNIYIGNDLGVWVSIDNGLTWEPLKSGMPTASIVVDFNILESFRKIRAVTHGNGIYDKSLVPPDENYINSVYDQSINRPFSVNCYPNPFIDYTYFNIDLAAPSRISISIYNNSGQVVKVFPDSRLSGGDHLLEWDGRNGQGDPCPSGTYFVRISTGNITHSFTLLRIN
jgi:hypothetical protein